MGFTDRKGALTDRPRRASCERRNRIYPHGADHAEFAHRNKRSRQQQEETPFRFTSSIVESRWCWSESKATAKPKFELPPPSPLKRTVQGPHKPTNFQKTRVSSESELDNQLEQEWMMPERCYDTSNLDLKSLESYKKRIAALQAKFAYTSGNHHSTDCAGVEDKGSVIDTYRGGDRIEDERFDGATHSVGIETEGEGEVVDSGRPSFTPVVLADVEIIREREGEREEGKPPEEAVKRTQGKAGERDSKLKANEMIALATAEFEALDVGKPPEEGELQYKRTHGKVAERDSKLKAIALDVGKPPEEGKPLYKQMQGKVAERDFKLKAIEMEIALARAKLEALQFKTKYKEKQDDEENEDDNGSLLELEKQVVSLRDALAPLDDEAEAEVARVLKGRRRQEVLVMHKSSNIEITKQTLECLMPGAWLNDEVINLYFELLKEREKRDPEKFLKCHFFNTFFYKKLYNKTKYDYKAVRRWTTHRKIGYSLTDCDKIFVPIHKEIHWCLAIIDTRAKKFQYLDSLKGTDARVLQVLAKYIADEAKDKTDQDLDVSNWDQEFVEDLPAQENGWDCGVFMIKYADFHSQDLPLSFSQENMPYFRTRTAKEILRLRAE